MKIVMSKGVAQMGGLAGKHVALTASRKTEEMEALLHKQGATSAVRSLQGTIIQDQETVTEAIKSGLATQPDWFIFTTGIGVQTLLAFAEEAGVKEAFLKQVRSAHIAVRGYKAKNALLKENIAMDVVSEDGTTAQLVEQLKEMDWNGKKVIVQQYGLPSPTLEQFLTEGEAMVSTWLPYIHYAPKGETIDLFLEELLEKKEYDAVCFTTALQVKALFSRASETGRHEQLLHVFAGPTVACAVGKVTAEALSEEGVRRVVYPKKERMGAMVVELGKFLEA